jgi:hypothetical protein
MGVIFIVLILKKEKLSFFMISVLKSSCAFMMFYTTSYNILDIVDIDDTILA